jgi:hypothetical protein
MPGGHAELCIYGSRFGLRGGGRLAECQAYSAFIYTPDDALVE